MAAALLVSAGAAAWLMRAATIGQPDASSRVVRFAVAAPDARRVSLVGDFDGWNPNAVPMRRGADGHTWIVDVHLAPGRHVFAYSIDGALRVDPAAPRAIEDDFGSPSSVVVVSEQGGD
jgi:1,4-alpha-glucan branching enzyme